VARRLWAADLGWHYQARIDLGGGKRIRPDFFHPGRRAIIEVESSEEAAKLTLALLRALRRQGYRLDVISSPDEVEEGPDERRCE